MSSPVWVCTCTLAYTAATSGVWPEREAGESDWAPGVSGTGSWTAWLLVVSCVVQMVPQRAAGGVFGL